MKILFVQAGGTIDKVYTRTGGSAYNFEIKAPAVHRILEDVNPTFEYRVVELLKKDSIDITDEDRQAMKNVCKNAKEDRIIITHGTDTMIQTAQFLDHLDGKVIILTGAMAPAATKTSDADFNVGSALGAVQTLKPGVYTAMSGQVKPWSALKKDYSKGRFISVNND